MPGFTGEARLLRPVKSPMSHEGKRVNRHHAWANHGDADISTGYGRNSLGGPKGTCESRNNCRIDGFMIAASSVTKFGSWFVCMGEIIPSDDRS